MLSKLILMGSLTLVCSMAFAAEESECGPAVEAADRLTPDSDKHCDYTKTGLNGVLHKAFSGKKSGEDEIVESKSHESKEKKVEGKVNKLIAKDEFSSAQQLQAVKYSLLEAAAGQCPKGFSVEAERYIPTATKALKLELSFQCL